MGKIEFSLECSVCGAWDIDEGVILRGEIICWDCVKDPSVEKMIKRIKDKKIKG